MDDDHVLAYAFDADHDALIDLPTLLGGKGAALVEMVAGGLPVPPGFTLTMEACHRFRQTGWDAALEEAVVCGLAGLEATAGKLLGGDPPLLVSVRSGARFSMPGMMDTVLNVGMSLGAEDALAGHSGDASFAADTHRRALVNFADVVLHAPSSVVEEARSGTTPRDIARILRRRGFAVPEDPMDQIRAAVRAVFESWDLPRARHYREVEGIQEDLGTAVTVQAMVFGNMGDTSGTGVAFTRDPATGGRGLMGDFLSNAQGEDVVAGGHVTLPLREMASRWPRLYAELEEIGRTLELRYADMADIEFTVERGRLWLLQSRRGKRSPVAALRMAVDMATDPAFPVDRGEAVRRCQPYLADPPMLPAIVDLEPSTTIATGLPASPGRASGVLCVDPEEAVRLKAAGVSAVLARAETSAADIHGIAASVALFTTRGGSVSHAAVVARSWGLPAVVGAHEAHVDAHGIHGDSGRVAVGDVVTVDGDAGRLLSGGSIHGGTIAPEVFVLRAWERESLATVTRLGSEGVRASFPLLHGLRIKGMASANALAGMLTRDVTDIEQALGNLAASGHAEVLQGNALWRLTAKGIDAHAETLSQERAVLPLGELPYPAFLDINGELKELCTAWQLRDGRPNDHADGPYDAAVLDRLADLGERAQPLLTRMAEIVPWLSRYGTRLAAAATDVRDGDHRRFTGMMCDSYHEIWMELHQDLILTLSIDRAVEGST